MQSKTKTVILSGFQQFPNGLMVTYGFRHMLYGYTLRVPKSGQQVKNLSTLCIVIIMILAWIFEHSGSLVPKMCNCTLGAQVHQLSWGRTNVLFVTYYSLLFTRFSLHVTIYSLLVTFYSLLVTTYSLLVTFYSLLVTFYLLLLTRYSLLLSRCFLLVTSCFLNQL